MHTMGWIGDKAVDSCKWERLQENVRQERGKRRGNTYQIKTGSPRSLTTSVNVSTICREHELRFTKPTRMQVGKRKRKMGRKKIKNKALLCTCTCTSRLSRQSEGEADSGDVGRDTGWLMAIYLPHAHSSQCN